MLKPVSLTALLTVVFAVTGYSGCGDGGSGEDDGSSERIRAAASTYLAGVAEADPVAVCSVLSTGELLTVAATVNDTAEDLIGTCEAEIAKDPPFDADRLSKAAAGTDSAELLMEGGAAVMQVPVGGFGGQDEAIIKFVKEGDAWKVDGQG